MLFVFAPGTIVQSADEFLTEYKDLLETTRYDFEISAYHAYDAMWALAFAFDRLALIHYPLLFVYCTML